MYKVLICDDEKKIRETFFDYLSAKGFKVSLAADGREAVNKTANESFDLIIMDVMMPVMNGLEACRNIRKSCDTPILFLSALGEEKDMLNGFGCGADDYIVKPFPMSVLVQKCNALINRHQGLKLEKQIELCGILLDKNSKRVFIDGNEILLPKKSFLLLALLMENKNIVLSREQIIFNLWDWDYDGDERAVDTHIKKLRKSLGEKSKHIKTVTGGGYTFREE